MSTSPHGVTVMLSGLSNVGCETGMYPTSVAVAAPKDSTPSFVDHPWFKPFEFHFSSDPAALQKQVGADLALIDRALAVLETQRRAGKGKLDGKSNVSELQGDVFLDGHVYVIEETLDQLTDLIVAYRARVLAAAQALTRLPEA